jgi:hypothetical protein
MAAMEGTSQSGATSRSAAVAAGKPALVNVVTDWRARATTAPFTLYST